MISDLTLKEVKEYCDKGCDYCPKELVKACKKTGYSLCLLEKQDLNKKIKEE